MSFNAQKWIDVGDPKADALMQRLQTEAGVNRVDQVLMQMVRNAEAVPAGLPDYLRDFLADEQYPHSERESAAVARAEEFYGAHGLSITMLLGFASLPWTYTLREGAAVLARTGQLTQSAPRRILETCQFVVDAFADGGLGPHGKGIRDAQKIRLMHAAIRYYIQQDGTWNVAERGVPVCQTDLVATFCSFTHVVLDGMEKMGVAVSPADAQAWIDTWRILGKNLGIEPELMPTTREMAAVYAAEIQSVRAGSTPEGKTLAAALVDFLAGLSPAHLMAPLVPTQIRFFLGDQRGDWLGLPQENASILLIHGINKLDSLMHRAEDKSSLLEHAGAGLGHLVVQGMLAAERAGSRPPFAIPPSLTRAWNLGER